MKCENCDKMLIAILQNDDYRDVIDTLNENGFYVTVLQSSGGFLKKSNATIMLGLNHEYLDEALGLLKQFGKRTELEYTPATSTVGMVIPPIPMGAVTIPVNRGGVVVFVLDIAQNLRY